MKNLKVREIAGKYYKPAKVVMLPTEKAENCLVKYDDGGLIWKYKSYYLLTQSYLKKMYSTSYHLYIITDDEIKEGDWYIDDTNTIRQSVTSNEEYWSKRKDYKKIIATTDQNLKYSTFSHFSQDLMKVAVYKDSLLHQPSISFIEKFIESYNQNKPIVDILVEMEVRTDFVDMLDAGEGDAYKLKLKDNTITIKKVKDNWSREEVIELLHKVTNFYHENRHIPWETWIEQNL